MNENFENEQKNFVKKSCSEKKIEQWTNKLNCSEKCKKDGLKKNDFKLFMNDFVCLFTEQTIVLAHF